MHSTHLLQVLAVALTTLSVAHGSVGLQAPRVPQGHHRMIKRQSGSDTAASSSTRQATTTSTTRATTTPVTTPTPTTPSPTTPTTTPATTPTTTAATSTTPQTTPTTSAQRETTPTTEQSSTTSQITITTVITATNSDGSLTTQTSQIVKATTVPSTNTEDKGMDESQRTKIIGGVVGGVGGAIFLAVIGLVAWRVWGRRKQQEEVDNTFGTSAYNVAEKTEPNSSSTNSRTPFQSTLESYHAPTQVNTASNF